jgi:hypothetical protein
MTITSLSETLVLSQPTRVSASRSQQFFKSLDSVNFRKVGVPVFAWGRGPNIRMDSAIFTPFTPLVTARQL